jgi:hypothetical protein
MTLGAIAALLCIVFGFIVGISEESILFDPLTWFVAAVAFGVLGGPIVLTRTRGSSAA